MMTGLYPELYRFAPLTLFEASMRLVRPVGFWLAIALPPLHLAVFAFAPK